MNLYVTNLEQSVTDEELKSLFSEFGSVASAEVGMDLFTGKSRGFGFVEMKEEEEARKAMTSLQQKEVHNQAIKIEETKPRDERKGSYKVGSGAIKAYRFRKN